ncbi:MAG: GMP synthase-like glutamine amidotransferase [Paracoccaceae bacterium]|jgi:GMP synthase-like glutamine amidotransferase
MHLAILMTNTDESDFADAHPKDGEKFTDLIQLVRPGWTTEAFAVKDGVFPDDLTRFDGVMITGSPASVLGDAPWVARLLGLIRDMDAAGMPMFGACFGHQAIALALGGRVGRNPGGWVHGLTRNQMLARPDWARDLPDEVRLYASHVEQVSALPDGAKVLSRSEGCDVTSFAIGGRVYTTQHHPEMTADFIAALTEELAPAMGPDLTDKARVSLADRADMAVFAESIALFFEQAATKGVSGAAS